ncbi:MAG: hypothetical protein IJV07_05610 [Alphaproteobacteria bacterium]|nr:hypothetical protein [Alphaproteobacteria bacterium]
MPSTCPDLCISVLKAVSEGKPIQTILTSIRQAIIQGVSLSESNYFLLRQLIDSDIYLKNRLCLIRRIIALPSFKYEANQNPAGLVNLLAISAYWLDLKLFDKKAIYHIGSYRTVDPAQTTHLMLLDIGVALINKGFHFSNNVIRFNNANAYSTLAPYSLTFLKQCRERYRFLSRKKAGYLHAEQLTSYIRQRED